MKTRLANSIIASFLAVTFVMPAAPALAETRWDDRQDRREDRRDDRYEDERQERREDRREYRRFDRRDDRRDERREERYEYRNGKPLLVIAPRHRYYGNLVIIRPHGHVYYGYGHYRYDDDAWKWLAFTAITLKILDNLDEQSQREHEAAQIKATTAAIGESISWQTASATGAVVATRQGLDANGLTCREFQQTINVGGKSESAYGTACLQKDGSWKIVN